MSPKIVLSLILVGILAGSIVSTILYKYVIHGTVDVGNGIARYDIYLDIRDPSGSKKFDLGILRIPGDGEIQIVIDNKRFKGEFNLSLSGTMMLSNSYAHYEIQMPCMIVHNSFCARPLMNIPGYDEPLKVAGGEYYVTLVLSWFANGHGKFEAEIIVKYWEKPASTTIEEIGDEPGDSTGWITAPGSTRSYALLVNTTEPYNGSIEAWAWMFRSGGDENTPRIFVFKILTPDQTIYYEKEFKVEPYNSTYYSIHVLVKTPLEHYILVWETGDIELSIEIGVYRVMD